MISFPPDPEPDENEDDEEIVDEVDFVELDDSTLPSTDGEVVNWDGEVVDTKKGTWRSQEAFRIGDKVITNEAVTAVSTTTVVLIILGIAIFLYISYRKREQIKVQARRASTFIRRTTKKLRATISGK